MPKVNYHTHTARCMHAEGADRDYVESALAGGFTTLGFSDHTPWRYAGGPPGGMVAPAQERSREAVTAGMSSGSSFPSATATSVPVRIRTMW